MKIHKELKDLSAILISAILLTGLTLQTRAQDNQGKDKPKDEKSLAGKSRAKDKPKEDSVYNSSLIGGLKFRSIGPAFNSGRIADFAVNPDNHSQWFVAVASGHVWKTVNNGTTFDPVFDNNGAYSIGCVVIDPNNTNVVWVGT